MNIYLVTQNFNNTYDTFDSMIIIAKDDEKAKDISILDRKDDPDTWATRNHLKADLLGKAVKGSEEKIVFQSFNAG